jgi:hypothetical protein
MEKNMALAGSCGDHAVDQCYGLLQAPQGGTGKDRS